MCRGRISVSGQHPGGRFERVAALRKEGADARAKTQDGEPLDRNGGCPDAAVPGHSITVDDDPVDGALADVLDHED